MTYYILIRGPLGCGKTTISKELAKELDADYISIDEVLDKNGLDVIDKDEGCIPARNFIKGDNIVLPEIKKKLEQGKIVILDGCFYQEKQIEHLKNSLDFDQYVFDLKLPLETCIERDSKRPLSYGEGAATAVYSFVSRFDHGTAIDISKSLKESVKEIISYLPKSE